MSARLHIATRKGLFTAKQTGRWRIQRASFVGDPVTIVTVDPRDRTLYAALEHGHFGVKVHRSRDGGQNWEECATPEYPPKPDDADDFDPIRKRPLEWKLRTVWALTPGGADQPGRIWCGTIPGGLFRSDDGGDSWALVRSLWDHPLRKKWVGGGADYPGIHSICVHPQNSRHVTIGVSCGGVWVTKDDGETWECKADGMRAAYMPPDQAFVPEIQDPHCVVQCREHPDYFWAQHHNGIFRTENACEQWTEIENVKPSTFGFAVAVHPNDPQTAWFIPAEKDEKRYPVDGQVVVTRTRDGGKTFDVLTEGLPQEHAYDLVYRHALDIDVAGNALAMGSTTGSLWVSDNQGDAWQTVSQHLPPIYCVRWENE